MHETAAKNKSEASAVDYDKVVQSSSFKELMQQKKNFIIPMSIFFMVFYFTLPVMTAYTTVLNQPAIGAISWAWIFAFAQFVMTVSLCMIYTRKARKFDEIVDRITKEAGR
ncbi:DUF485 domain-containing protein [Peribacillus glennii]|uniref:DUF485 domain-containing protein n=1 Tax=Peribacillus glennii TaxID=2303991 RepID=A0A372LB52_9BACI|nr:DUF485 domain-containing protein [Peribacillus glennii]RFU62529.1 DUF485 domain-containing protein [Peribacillus glennii]